MDCIFHYFGVDSYWEEMLVCFAFLIPLSLALYLLKNEWIRLFLSNLSENTPEEWDTFQKITEKVKNGEPLIEIEKKTLDKLNKKFNFQKINDELSKARSLNTFFNRILMIISLIILVVYLEQKNKKKII